MNFSKKMMVGAISMALTGGFVFSSCSSDDNELVTTKENVEKENSTERSISLQEAQFGAAVAKDLATQAVRLEASWAGLNNVSQKKQQLLADAELEPTLDYGAMIKSAGESGNTTYPTLTSAFEQIFGGALDISGEVGNSKITDPLDSKDVLDVESWYSWNSLADFADNIRSIQNAYLGGRPDQRDAAKSVSAYIKSFTANNGVSFDKQIKDAISDAISKINAMPAPFRNNLDANNVNNKAAKEACLKLSGVLEDAQAFVQNNRGKATMSEADQKAVLAHYVDHVVVPTYRELADAALELQASTSQSAEKKGMTTETCQKVCDNWRAARVYWEQSEAFLFGAAADYNIDPHIDSWPLDKAGLDQTLKLFRTLKQEEHADFVANNLGYGLLGFHAVEYVYFRAGQPRVK